MIIFRYILPILQALKGRPFSTEANLKIMVNTFAQESLNLNQIPENVQIYKLEKITKDELTKIGNEIPLNRLVVAKSFDTQAHSCNTLKKRPSTMKKFI